LGFDGKEENHQHEVARPRTASKTTSYVFRSMFLVAARLDKFFLNAWSSEHCHPLWFFQIDFQLRDDGYTIGIC
jgi:hypothetical protein